MAVPIAGLDRARGSQADTTGAVLNGRGPLNACFNMIKVDSLQKRVEFRLLFFSNEHNYLKNPPTKMEHFIAISFLQ